MPVDVDRLDLLADDLRLEVAPDRPRPRGAQASPAPIRSPRSGEALLASPCNRSHATRAAACSACLLRAALARRRTPRRRGAPWRRTASRGRGPRRAPGTGAAGRTAAPRAPGAASCSPARPGRSPPRGCGAPSSRSTSRARRLEPAVEVHRGDHRLHRVGEDRRLRAPARRVLALAEPQRTRPRSSSGRDLGERLGVHDRRRAPWPARPRACCGVVLGRRSR